MEATYRVWKGTGPGMGVSVNEICIMNTAGDYVGIQTGHLFPHAGHYHSVSVPAVISSVDEENRTGMLHLDADGIFGVNKKLWKQRYIGCHINVIQAHRYGDLKVYRCTELDEYFSQNELTFADGTSNS